MRLAQSDLTDLPGLFNLRRHRFQTTAAAAAAATAPPAVFILGPSFVLSFVMLENIQKRFQRNFHHDRITAGEQLADGPKGSSLDESLCITLAAA